MVSHPVEEERVVLRGGGKEGGGVVDTKRVDVIGEMGAVNVVEGVDDLVLRYMELCGEGEDRDVGIAEVALLDEGGETMSEGVEVVSRRRGGGTGYVEVEALGGVSDAEAEAAHE